MATIQSSLSRFQTSAQGSRVPSGVLVTTVTPIRPPASRLPMPRSNILLSLPKEPEDARLTGGTRSLDRRLLALNLSGGSVVRSGGKGVAVPGRAVVTPRSAA